MGANVFSRPQTQRSMIGHPSGDNPLMMDVHEVLEVIPAALL